MPKIAAPSRGALFAAVLALAPSAALADPAPRAAKAAAPGKPIVLVVGDRFATALADGLEGDPSVLVSRTTGDGFGLTRASFSDSLPTIRDRLARADKPSLAAVMVGTVDREPLSDAAGRHEPGTPEWAKLFGERVDAVSKVFRDAGVPLVWVGLPPVRSPDLSALFVRENGIIRDRAAADGAAYVDSFDGFTDEAGRFSPVGPAVDGTPAKLRRADGLGFTRAGEKKLASLLAPEVGRLGRGSAAASAAALANLTIERARGFDAALDVDVSAQIRREAARGGGEAARDAGLPASLAALPQGPPAGPVLPLTAPPSAPDGQLASLALPTGAPLSAEPSLPRPGRADDFSWPKP